MQTARKQVQAEIAETSITKLTYLYFQTFNSFVFPYFNLNILRSIHLFCIRLFFVIDFFSSIVWFLKTHIN